VAHERTIEEMHMTTKAHSPLDEIRDRIDRLEARVHTAEAKVQQLETSLKSAGHALAVELAENERAVTDAMHARRDEFKKADAARKKFR
jgi:chaperonin cofactor prefoldin